MRGVLVSACARLAGVVRSAIVLRCRYALPSTDVVCAPIALGPDTRCPGTCATRACATDGMLRYQPTHPAYATGLRAHYAMSGTDMRSVHPQSQRHVVPFPPSPLPTVTILRIRYAVFGMVLRVVSCMMLQQSAMRHAVVVTGVWGYQGTWDHTRPRQR
eukprot:3057169-Rhodomonas_salina.6